MISLGQEQHLGYKAFIIIVLKRMSPGIIFLILVSAIALFSHYLSGGMIRLLTTEGIAQTDAVNISSTILIYATIIIFGIGILFCFLGFLVAYFQYASYTYTFTEFDLTMKKGILDKKETSIPYRQIQDINIDRPLVYQLLGLSKLILRTAGTEEKNERGMTEINIEPINTNIAEEIQSMLERKIGVQVVEDETKADKEE